MMDLTPVKLLIIAVVALVVLGPDKLPGMARQIGATWADLRQWRSRIEAEVRNTFPDLPDASKLTDVVRSPLGYLDRLADDHERQRLAGVDDTSAGSGPPGAMAPGDDPAGDGGPGSPFTAMGASGSPLEAAGASGSPLEAVGASGPPLEAAEGAGSSLPAVDGSAAALAAGAHADLGAPVPAVDASMHEVAMARAPLGAAIGTRSISDPPPLHGTGGAGAPWPDVPSPRTWAAGEQAGSEPGLAVPDDPSMN